MKKVFSREQARTLTDIPNIGKAVAQDLLKLGIDSPQKLVRADPLELYKRLERVTGQRHDPCMLDVLMAAVDFMNGAPKTPWWFYTSERKILLSKLKK